MATERQKNFEVIRDEAVKLLKKAPEGIKYSQLIKDVMTALPDQKEKDVKWAVYDLNKTRETAVDKPARGLFKAK